MNPHAVLGVAPNATPSEIKSAYRKLAMQHHPDRNGGSEESAKKFQEVQAAYDALRGDKPQQHQQHQHQPHGFNQQENGFEFHMNMHDMFDNFFRRHNAGNPSIQAQCEIGLDQAFTGCSVSFNVNGKTVVVDVPAGINHGQMLRVHGAAGQPDPNYPPGDLIVVIRVRPHGKFQRHGMTLITPLPINLLDLITGCEKEIEGIDGKMHKITIPENTNPITTLTIPGAGMPVPQTDQVGEMIVCFEVEYPTFTKQQLNTLRKMKKS
jgi:curved DNA-binding protein